MVQVGIMHGRLTPRGSGSFQCFPADSWRKEFSHARDAGLACIEWIYEVPNEARNPLGSAEGIAEMKALSAQTGVGVRSVCADYFMTDQLLDSDGKPIARNLEKLRALLSRAAELGVTYIVLPFVDPSTLGTKARIAGATALLRQLGGEGQAAGVELHLETDLPPADFATLLAAIASPWVKANFDIGNSASLGYDPAVELPALAPYLGSVHVKDRVLGGSTVPLGTGNARFETVFRELHRAGFDRWYILQAARGNDGEEVELARRNREFVERQVAAAAGLE